jgi:hypothetical protein
MERKPQDCRRNAKNQSFVRPAGKKSDSLTKKKLKTLVPIPLIERVGRRKLMIFSAAGQAITMAILAAIVSDVLCHRRQDRHGDCLSRGGKDHQFPPADALD